MLYFPWLNNPEQFKSQHYSNHSSSLPLTDLCIPVTTRGLLIHTLPRRLSQGVSPTKSHSTSNPPCLVWYCCLTPLLFVWRHFITDLAPMGQRTQRSVSTARARRVKVSLVQPANKLRACLQHHSNQFIRTCHYASGLGSSITDGCCEEACSASDKGDTPHHSVYVKSRADQSQLSPTAQPLPSSCPDTRSDSRKTTVVICPALRGEKRLHMDALV